MAVEPGAIVRAVAKMTDINGSQIQNVYFYKHQGDTEVTAAAFLTALEIELSAMYAEIEDALPTTLTSFEIEADRVQFISGKLVTTVPVGTIDWTTWTGGVGTGEGLPQGNAAVLNFSTGIANVVGRKYLGPLMESSQANGELETSVQTLLAAYIVEYLSGFITSAQQFDAVLMSTKAAAVVGILEGIVRAVVGYQRRRKAGRGI